GRQLMPKGELWAGYIVLLVPQLNWAQNLWWDPADGPPPAQAGRAPDDQTRAVICGGTIRGPGTCASLYITTGRVLVQSGESVFVECAQQLLAPNDNTGGGNAYVASGGRVDIVGSGGVIVDGVYRAVGGSSTR